MLSSLPARHHRRHLAVAARMSLGRLPLLRRALIMLPTAPAMLRRARTGSLNSAGGARSSGRRSGALGGATASQAAPRHFLLYLNKQTYKSGDALAQEVRAARSAGVPIAMIHEKDEARGGCGFSTFFQTSRAISSAIG
eukprot:203374-Prymnesium_polylepis.1